MAKLSSGPHSSVSPDIYFEITNTGYEIWHSDRLAHEHPELVDQSADYLEDQIGVLNLGQIDHRVLMADGPLTDEVKDGLVAWWRERVDDLKAD